MFLGFKRSRDAAVCVFVFLAWIAVWIRLWFMNPDSVAFDFTQFYILSRIPVHSLYDQTVFQGYGREHLKPLGIGYYPPFVRPAVFSIPFLPLALLPYWTGFIVYAGIQFGFYLWSLFLAVKHFRCRPELLAFMGTFYPAIMGIVIGQDGLTITLLLMFGLILLLQKKDALAGAVLALTLYKFNLTLFVPVAFALCRRYRSLGWYVACGVVLAGASALLAPPEQYVALLRNIQPYTIGFSPEKMIGFRGLCYRFGFASLYLPLALMTVAVSVRAMSRLPLFQSFCVGLLGALLCGYHVSWYDGAMLFVPIALAFTDARPKYARPMACVLLLAFPVWAIYPTLLTGLLLVYFVLSCWPAFGAAREGAAAPPKHEATVT